MELVTKGLGAGSYPEPPREEEFVPPACQNCGSEEGFPRLFEGEILCESCRKEALVREYGSLAGSYVDSTPERKEDFYLSFLFCSLPREGQVRLLCQGCKKERGAYLEEYLRENPEDFYRFLKERR